MKTPLFLFACLLFMTASLNAQFPYFLSTSTSSYQDLTNDIVIAPVDDNTPWDDPEGLIPIGFPFEIDSVSYSQLAFVQLGGYLSFAGFGSGEYPLLYPYGSDLADRGLLTGIPESSISYVVEGQAGSRTFKMQWKNAGFYQEMVVLGTNNDFVNLQFWIYEGSNDMEVHFGESSITNDSLAHLEFGGQPLIGLIEKMDFPALFKANSPMYFLSGQEDAPFVDSTNWNLLDKDAVSGLSDNPPDGRIYAFTTSPRTNTRNVYLKELNVFPSPATDYVSIDLPENVTTNDMNIIVTDMGGKTIHSSTYQKPIIDCASWPSGIYQVQLVTNNIIYSAKIIKK